MTSRAVGMTEALALERHHSGTAPHVSGQRGSGSRWWRKSSRSAWAATAKSAAI